MELLLLIMLNKALTLFANGIPVFPCRPDTKRPYTDNGFKDATTDEKQVRAWWRRWPDAWIGVPGGEINFFDIDAKYQAGLVKALEDRAKETGLDWILSLPKQTTVNGGAHLLFRCPDAEVRNKTYARNANKDTTIETRGSGGYGIVAP